MRYLLIMIAVWSTVFTVSAQHGPKAKDDKQLVGIFAGLTKIDGYAFHITQRSSLVEDTQKAVTVTMNNYQSKDAFVMYSNSDNGLLFLSERGQFKVDYAKKSVYYRLFDNDSLLASAKQQYTGQFQNVLDSLFLADAVILQKKETKKNVSYRLKYPEQSTVKAFNIVLRLSDAIPETVSYTIDRPLNANTKGIWVRQQLTIDHYQHGMPEEVRSLIAATKNLYPYLQQKYAGYTLQKI
jgi:hypothetical protein